MGAPPWTLRERERIDPSRSAFRRRSRRNAERSVERFAQDQAVVDLRAARRAEDGQARALEPELVHQALHAEPAPQADAAVRLEREGAHRRAAQALVELRQGRGV